MQSTTILADQEGRVVDGRFTLVRWLGGTAEGSVYLTATTGAGAGKAAIKLVPADSLGAEARLAGWAAAARINHPHVLRVLHTGRAKLEEGTEGGSNAVDVVYAVTEFADELLSEILPERPLTTDEAQDMLWPVLDALACLHERGYAHARLKPSNILVVGDSLKVSGECFPLAVGKIAVNPGELGVYDAPELSRGTLAHAGDIWSLGMTLAAALTQHTPAWDRETGFEPVVRPALPDPFEGIVRECLRMDTGSRLTLDEIRARLEGEAPAEGQSEEEDEATPAFASRWAPVWIASAVFLGIGVTALILHGRQSPSPVSATEPAPTSATGQQPPNSSSSQDATAQPTAEEPAPAQPVHTAQAAPQPASRPPASDAAAAGAGSGGAVLKRVLPEVSRQARSTIHGTVSIPVRVHVDAGGAVTDAESERPGASRYFNRVAIQAAQAWQFSPAQAEGQAAPSVWLLHFEFRANGTTVTADQQTR